MKMIKIFNSILAFGLLLMSIGSAFGQTPDERKLELVVQTGHSSSIESVAFSPDGKLLASSSFDIKIWDVASGLELKTLGRINTEIRSVVFSPDGKLLASGGADDIARIWNLVSGKEVKIFKGHTSSINSVVFSPDGKMLATGSDDHTIKLWNVSTEQEIMTLKGHSESVSSIAFSPNGKLLVSGSWDKTIKLWDVANGQEIATLVGHSKQVRSVAFSPDGKMLASGSLDQTIKLWNVTTKSEVKTLTGHTDTVESLIFLPNSKIIISLGGIYDGTIRFWDIETGFEQKRFYSSYASSIALSPGGKMLAGNTIIDKDFIAIKLWDLDSDQEIKILGKHADSVGSPIFSPDKKMIAYFSRDKTIKLWNISSGKGLKSLVGHTHYISSIAFSPDSKILASASYDKTIKLWDVVTGQEIQTLKGHSDSIISIAFSTDGKTIVSGGDKGFIKLWDATSGREIKSTQISNSQIKSVAFSPDDKMLATVYMRKSKETIFYFDTAEITLWDVDSGQLLKTIQDAKCCYIAYSAMFSPDGKILAVSKLDEFPVPVQLWDVMTGNEIKYDNLPEWATFGNEEEFSQVNGRIIQTQWDSEKTNLIDFNTKQILFTLIALDENDWAIITPDGRFEASEGALKLMHYSYGLEVINLEQLKEVYYEPGLLQKLLGYSKEPLRSIVPLKDVKLYPEILEQNFDGNTGKLNLKLKSRGGGIGKTEVFVNGKRVVEDARDERLKQNPNVPIDTVVSLTVDVPPSAFVKGVENQIKIITSNYLKEIGKGNIQSRGVGIVYLDKGNAALELPTLYAIVGGVSDYTGDALDLRFAAKDAEDFSNALRLGANRLFCPSNKAECLGKINITTLSTARQNAEEQPTKENFKKAFADIAAKAKPEDIFLVYLAGHGVTLGAGTDTYFYLTKDARAAGKADLEKNFQTVAISSQELTDWLTPNKDNPNDIFVKALKQVIILDTCAAGNFAKEDWKKDRDLSGDQIRAMEFLKDKTGTFILMGSASNAVSYEANRYNQGLLTYALLEGIKGFALQKATNNVDVRLLFDYAEKRVPDLAKDMNLDQRPIIKQPSGNTFLIGQMTDAEKTKINLPQPKPLLLRPLLTNPETGDDDLKLIPELRKRFDAESSYEVMQRSGKGEPALIYIDDDSFPGAVRVTGTYTVEGDKVRVKAFLRRDGNTIATLNEIIADKDKVINELLSAIRVELAKITAN